MQLIRAGAGPLSAAMIVYRCFQDFKTVGSAERDKRICDEYESLRMCFSHHHYTRKLADLELPPRILFGIWQRDGC